MIFSTYCAHTDPIFKDLNVLTIDKLVIHRIGIMMYKFKNGLLPNVLNSLYKNNGRHNLRVYIEVYLEMEYLSVMHKCQ